MKNLNGLNQYRINYRGWDGDEHNGAFELTIKGEKYFAIASNGDGWDHVSVSHKHKIPSWKTMCEIKNLFFENNEVVMQLHVPSEDHINICKTCLHLWRPQIAAIPLPPKICV